MSERPPISYISLERGKDADFDKFLYQVARLDKECMQGEFISASPWEYADYADQVKQSLRSGMVVAQLLKVNGGTEEVIGTFFWAIPNDEPNKIMLYMCAVKSQFRNQGVANGMSRALYSFFTKDFEAQKEKGESTDYLVGLVVHEKNFVAIEMYEKYGLVETNRYESLYMSGDGIEMTCPFSKIAPRG